ncbi:sterol desaturase family protein [Gallaecimonas pentaromativorans]|uniref:Sterol desaturase/sphingolipid hydroxylase (Fatty acid hydroxylase superfamily) n=1 Tax=Gallaecimonas pentaromativorans TaxID=584787 RepID=A0A3N1NSN2_9GAMM|nr:sterol desaturase family protein [Gallaecimonas pentaromativorans]ROQ19195.1 sterol desaturase/sphingolipid hydroxylase (fatty acid hydroxylase superfamily) [Gallaecimonas pentaromativorans]
MSKALRDKYEDVDLSPGQGKGSAALALFLGSLSLLGALCFWMPAVFTTPEFRGFYNTGILKPLLQLCIVLGFGCGLFSMMRHQSAGYGLTGMVLAVAAALVGSGHIEAPNIDGRNLYVGLDYFVLTLVVLALVFVPLERAFPKDPAQNILRKGWITDLKYFMFSHMGVQLISFFTVIPVQVFLHQVTTWEFQLWIAAQPIWLQFIEILLVVDFGTYWIHRTMHEIPALWKIHAVHHSTEQMNWLASSRLHLIEILVNRLAGYLPIFVLGFAPSAVYAYLVFISFHAIFIHANVRFRFPVLRWLLATPEYHHWHHSSEDEAIDKNYAGFLPIYDVLFGTVFMPKHLASRYGTVSDNIPDGIVGQFLYPFRSWFKRSE